jgi:hypothetical protein
MLSHHRGQASDWLVLGDAIFLPGVRVAGAREAPRVEWAHGPRVLIEIELTAVA